MATTNNKPINRTPHTSLAVVAGSSLAGTAVEWYDFFLYGTAAALVFNKLFFPAHDPMVGTMLAFATYAVGFVARPVGAAVLGHFGDIKGRRATLIASLMLMGVSTFLIAFLPTYATIGITAPAILVLLRLIQGFALGGEWGGAVLLVSEHGNSQRRAFWSALPNLGPHWATCSPPEHSPSSAPPSQKRRSCPGDGESHSPSRHSWSPSDSSYACSSPKHHSSNKPAPQQPKPHPQCHSSPPSADTGDKSCSPHSPASAKTPASTSSPCSSSPTSHKSSTSTAAPD